MNRCIVILATIVGVISGCAFAEDAVKVPANCIVTHMGYRGTIVAPGISKPTGKIAKLVCNGKEIDLASDSINDGLVSTKEFGDIGIRFGSMVATIGAGDFTSVRPGSTAQEPAVEMYISASKVAVFTAFIGPKPN